MPNVLDLTQLAEEFDPAIIYGFDPEILACYSESTLDFFMHITQQYEDIWNTYSYAQLTILPCIREKGILAVTPEQLLVWINELHSRVARTVAAGVGFTGGEYAKEQVAIWHHDCGMQEELLGFLSNLTHLMPSTDWLYYTRKRDIPDQKANNFLALTLRMRDDQSIIIPPDRPFIPNPLSMATQGELALHKLIIAYQTDQLSQEDKKLVNDFIKVCIPPSSIAENMQLFAKTILEEWQMLCENRASLSNKQVTLLAFNTFFKLTEIHPYPNCNGRLATCLMNIILRSLDFPSIIIRHPDEKTNNNSPYSIAIKAICEEPQRMIDHIQTRIENAAAGKSYTDLALERYINLQIELYEIIQKIKHEFPTYNIDDYYEELVTHIDFLTLNNQEKQAIFPHIVEKFKTLFPTLQPKSHSSMLAQITQHSYTDEEKTRIVEKLTELTQQSGWKTYKTNGLTILLELSDQNLRNSLVQALQKTNAMNVLAKKNPANNKFVVYINNIVTEKLNNVESLSLPHLETTEDVVSQSAPSSPK